MSELDDALVARKTWLGHPRGLFTLFFSEMWERFSFYGMRALLTLYMVKVLGYTDDASAGVYGAYGALVYLFPVAGGYLAEKVLGYRHAIVLGGSMMAIGHALMAIQDETFFYLALGFLCIGNGFFKPNISSTVGKLYEEGDPRRDSGFTIFYMGINLGALLAPWICGPLGEDVGWHWGFGAAAIGMVIGLIQFIAGTAYLEGKAESRSPELLKKMVLPGLNVHMGLWVAACLVAPVAAILLYFNEVTSWLLYASGVVVLAVLFKMAMDEDKVGRQRLYSLMILMGFHMMFWAFFEQAGSSLTLLADRVINRNMPFIGEQPASWFQGVNPFFILAFAPFFSILWVKLGKRNPSIPRKFALGLLQLGLGYGLLVFGLRFTPDGYRVPWMFLVFMYMLHTTGELCLSPVGLSAVTKLAPAKATGFVMGAWFMTISFGHLIAGGIAKLTKVEFVEGSPEHALTDRSYTFTEEAVSLASLAKPEKSDEPVLLTEAIRQLGENGVEAQAVLDHGVAQEWFTQEAATGISQLIEAGGGSAEAPVAAADALEAYLVGPIIDVYLPVYEKVFYVALGLGVVLFLTSGRIKKLMHGVE